MLSQAEKNVFGADAEEHPVTGMALEGGRGALSHDHQAHIHCNEIERAHGKEEADKMRARLRAHIEERDRPAPEPEPEPAPEMIEFVPIDEE